MPRHFGLKTPSADVQPVPAVSSELAALAPAAEVGPVDDLRGLATFPAGSGLPSSPASWRGSRGRQTVSLD